MIAGFVGKVYLDGSLATSEEVMRLKDNLLALNGSYVKAMSLGALAIATSTQIRNKNIENELIITDNQNCIIVGSGSIYNKDEVVAALGKRGSFTDLELMWYGWLRFGNDAVKYLNGDWMFAVYDKRKGEVAIYRSWGLSSMYYYRGQDFLAFATHPALLSELPKIPSKPDLRIITQTLCNLPISPKASAWMDIKQLPPASRMLISKSNIKEEIWWRPSKVKKITISDEREVLEQFLTLYRKAVIRRLTESQKVGATLSSGLDSSSICMLAAEELLSKGKSLQAWTSTPYYQEEASSIGNWLADEGKLASNFIETTRNITHTLVDAREADPINAIRFQILRTGRPQSSVANLYWIDSILTSAKASDCNVVLIGQFGNSTVSYSPFNISLFPKRRYFPQTSWESYLKIIKQKTIRNIRSTKQMVSNNMKRDNKSYPTLNQEYVKDKNFKHNFDNFYNTKKITQANCNEIHMGSFDLWYHSSLWNGIEVRDPTLDMELTEFLLSLPDHIYFRDNLDRRLIRLGLEGLLPDAIRLNKRRGQQASDIVPRVRHFSKQALHALSVIEKSKQAKELLNTERMSMILNNIMNGATGITVFKECSRILLPGLSAGLFLASFDTEYDLNEPL